MNDRIEVAALDASECENCHDANKYGDYEGPTCDVCGGTGRQPQYPGSVRNQPLAERSRQRTAHDNRGTTHLRFKPIFLQP